MQRFSTIWFTVCFILPLSFVNSYKSLIALDQYGASPQINNARLASQLNSMPMIVTSAHTSLIAVSLEKRHAGSLPRNKCSIIGQSENNILAALSSGLGGDAIFLTKLLRRDVMNTWERYDCMADCSRICHTASRIFLGFMGRNGEIHDGSVDVLIDGNGDRLSIGRPLAVNLMVSKLNEEGVIEMMSVEPSGRCSVEIVGKVFGKGCQKGDELLQQRWRGDLDALTIEKMCIEIMREITLNEYLVGDHGEESDYNIIVEILDCKNGLSIKRLPFVSRADCDQGFCQ